MPAAWRRCISIPLQSTRHDYTSWIGTLSSLCSDSCQRKATPSTSEVDLKIHGPFPPLDRRVADYWKLDASNLARANYGRLVIFTLSISSVQAGLATTLVFTSWKLFAETIVLEVNPPT